MDSDLLRSQLQNRLKKGVQAEAALSKSESVQVQVQAALSKSKSESVQVQAEAEAYESEEATLSDSETALAASIMNEWSQTQKREVSMQKQQQPKFQVVYTQPRLQHTQSTRHEFDLCHLFLETRKQCVQWFYKCFEIPLKIADYDTDLYFLYQELKSGEVFQQLTRRVFDRECESIEDFLQIFQTPLSFTMDDLLERKDLTRVMFTLKMIGQIFDLWPDDIHLAYDEDHLWELEHEILTKMKPEFVFDRSKFQACREQLELNWKPKRTSNVCIDFEIPPVLEITQVTKWLDRIDMIQYAHKFQQDGWDDLATIAMMTESDLRSLGILNGHVRKIEREIRKLRRRELMNAVVDPDIEYGIEIMPREILGHVQKWQALRTEMRLPSDLEQVKQLLKGVKEIEGIVKNQLDKSLLSVLTAWLNLCKQTVQSFLPYESPVVIELGSHTWKCGFLFQKDPICVPAVVCSTHTHKYYGFQTSSGSADARYQYLLNPTEHGNLPEEKSWKNLIAMFEYIYSEILHTSMSQHPLFIIEPTRGWSINDRLTLQSMLGHTLIKCLHPNECLEHYIDLGESGISSSSTFDVREGGYDLTRLCMYALCKEGLDFRTVLDATHTHVTRKQFIQYRIAQIIKEYAFNRGSNCAITKEQMPMEFQDEFECEIVMIDQDLVTSLLEQVSESLRSISVSKGIGIVLCGGMARSPGIRQLLPQCIVDYDPSTTIWRAAKENILGDLNLNIDLSITKESIDALWEFLSTQQKQIQAETKIGTVQTSRGIRDVIQQIVTYLTQKGLAVEIIREIRMFYVDAFSRKAPGNQTIEELLQLLPERLRRKVPWSTV